MHGGVSIQGPLATFKNRTLFANRTSYVLILRNRARIACDCIPVHLQVHAMHALASKACRHLRLQIQYVSVIRGQNTFMEFGAAYFF